MLKGFSIGLTITSLVLSSFTPSAEAQNSKSGSGRGQAPYAVVLHGAGHIDANDPATACLASIEAAVKACIEAGGTPESLTSIPPTIDKVTFSVDGGSTTHYYYCRANISCIFPSRNAVPYGLVWD